MNSLKNAFLLLCVLSALALSILAWRQHEELVLLRSKTEETASRASLEKSLADAQNNVRELERQLTETRNPKAPAKSSGSTALPIGPDGSLASIMPGLAAFLDRPEMQRALTNQEKANIERRFSKLFKQLNLSPEQLEKFKALLLERQTTAMDSMIIAAQKGINPMQGGAEMGKLVKESQKEIDTQIKELLGASNYSQYDEYKRSEPQRQVVAQLQQDLGYSDEPLNKTQVSQLTQVLAETKPQSNKEPYEGTMITDEGIDRSRSFLSPTQVQSLETLQKQQKAAALLRRSIAPATGTSTPTPGTP